jgi:DNA-binding response OmpR family regulator
MMNKIKLLIVDDNKIFLETLKEFLSDSGYDVAYCNNGKEAQMKFSEFMPDILVTDIIMPDVDGIELILGLRKISPNVRVIAMSGGFSGHDADTYLHMAEKLGANVILKKPFEFSELLEQIQKLEIAA